MNGWQEPNDGKRIYLITDNTKMDGFTDYIKPEDIEHLYVTYSESRVNLGIHYYRNSLYSSNLVGICRIKSVDDETLYDAEGNELLIKVVPRFNVTVVELLNYIRDDDEFDRYMAPQTISKSSFDRHLQKILKLLNMTVEDLMLYHSTASKLLTATVYSQNVPMIHEMNGTAKKQYNLLLDVIDSCAIYY